MEAKMTTAPTRGYGLNLTPREKEVAHQVLHGKTNKQIGSILSITEKTVKYHLTSVYKKLRVKSRHEMMVLESGRKGKRLFTSAV